MCVGRACKKAHHIHTLAPATFADASQTAASPTLELY